MYHQFIFLILKKGHGLHSWQNLVLSLFWPEQWAVCEPVDYMNKWILLCSQLWKSLKSYCNPIAIESFGVVFFFLNSVFLSFLLQVCLSPLSDLNLHLSTAASGAEAWSPSPTSSLRWTAISHFSPSPDPKEAAAQKSWMMGLLTPANQAQNITAWRQLPAPIIPPRPWTLAPGVGEGPRSRTFQPQIQEACPT